MNFFRIKFIQRIGAAVGVVGLVAVLVYFFGVRPPSDFPAPVVVSVGHGKGLTEISHELKAKHIIRSPFWFTNFVILLKRERAVVGGEYYFDQPANAYEVARKLTSGSFNIKQIKTTIPEGSTVYDIANILKKNYPTFDAPKFYALAQEKEGHLFPDTYMFGADVKPERVVDVMTSNFKKKIEQKEVVEAVQAFGRPVEEVVTMASILEGEARQTRTRRIVAGILWERLRRGIPLQVDVAFKYVNGKTTEDLTLSDLKIDSPYNTYMYTGLTPTPISNPGIDSIIAAATPIKTEYLYFLTDKNGEMHYARTLEEHKENRDRYLSR